MPTKSPSEEFRKFQAKLWRFPFDLRGTYMRRFAK
jgi:hypothetical protein